MKMRTRTKKEMRRMVNSIIVQRHIGGDVFKSIFLHCDLRLQLFNPFRNVAIRNAWRPAQRQGDRIMMSIMSIHGDFFPSARTRCSSRTSRVGFNSQFMHPVGQRLATRCFIKASATPISNVLRILSFQHRPFSISHKFFASKKSEPQARIQWFRQNDDGSISDTPLDPDKDIIDQEDAEEAAILKRRIAQLEQELSVLRGEKSTLIEPLLAEVPEEEQARIREAIRKDEEENPDPIEPEEDDDDVLPSQGIPSHEDLTLTLELKSQEAADLKRLYYCIRRTIDDSEAVVPRKRLWRAYLRCKLTLPPFLHLIPEEWWLALWKSQSSVKTSGPDRAEHLCVLLEDMIKNGRDLNFQQKMAFIESLVYEQRADDAFKYWRLYEADLANDEGSQSRYRAMGLQISASRGEVEQSYRMAMELLETEQRPQSEAVVPVITLMVQRGSDAETKKAWALYLRLKTGLGLRMNIADYDTISMCFLKAGRSDLALAVFKDLMLSNQDSRFTSTELFRTSTATGLVGELQKQSIDAQELIKVSLTALTYLPKHLQNKFFYGSWMKKLIGMGEIDAAATILDLMHERGVTPDAKHLNGIIGGWSREGSVHSQEKLEQMAWAMVRSRLDLVRQRHGRSSPVQNHDNVMKPAAEAPTHLRAIVCPATIETFSLLLLHYQARGLPRHMEAVEESLRQAEIIPNSYFMNHLLFAQLHRGDQPKVWEIYSNMARTVHPDLETFACLWDSEKAWLDKLSSYQPRSFPSPRHIFRIMISWMQSLSKRDRKHTLAAFSNALYSQILRCFCLSKDLGGAIVALYALRDALDVSPSEDTARLLLMQVARMGASEAKFSRRRRAQLSSVHSQGNMGKITQLLEIVTQRRAEDLRGRGTDPQALDEDQQRGEQLFMLANFLRAVMEQKLGDAGLAQVKIDEAKTEMCMDGLLMEDPFL